MLTLAESTRRNVLEAVTAADLNNWREAVKAKCLALIKFEFEATPFAQIGDIDMKSITGPLDDGLADAVCDITWELES